MTEYVVIDGATWPINTETEIAAATRALSEAGVNSAAVWRSPSTIDAIVEHGDPDGVKTHYVLLADSNVSPEENGS
jgi:hypothetical protein